MPGYVLSPPVPDACRPWTDTVNNPEAFKAIVNTVKEK